MAVVTAQDLTEVVVEGRPDFENQRFGVTQAKRFPPYVYSTGHGGSLVHRVAGVELQWYGIGRAGACLVRLRSPVAIATTVCGQTKFLGTHSRHGPRQRLRAATCVLPSPDAVLCGRCHGEPATFGKHGAGTRAGISRRDAHRVLGCVAEEVEP